MFKGIKSILLSVFIPAVLQAATISGTVTARGTGDAIADAKVVLVSQQGPIDSTTTDAKGAYSFDSVSTGFRTVAAYKDGYQAATANVGVLQNTGKYTANIVMTASTGGTQTGTIVGTVKDDSTKEALSNATVILSHTAGRGEPTPIDTVQTDGEGRFIFTAVPALNNYIVEASATGFSSATNNNVDVVAKDTAKVPLTLKKLPKPTSAIIGKVSDADTKGALPKSVVILRKRVLTNTQIVWENQDTTTTDSSGAFSFSNIAASTNTYPYSLLVSCDGFNSTTSGNIIVGANQTDTVNVALTKVAMGSMSIYVGLDSAGNKALAGADVAASLTGQAGKVYTGTTDAKGWVTFAEVIAGSYSVSANLDGFVSKEVTRAVAANEKDTGNIYLARATAQNSKSLSGLVRDADGKAIAGAKVIFEGNGANGLTLFTTSSTTGDYDFSGIPTATSGGRITVQKAGYADFTGTVTLGGAASFLNVSMKTVVSVARQASDFTGFRLVRGGQDISLEFPVASVPGRVSLFDARGSRVFSASVAAGSSRLNVSGKAGIQYLVLERAGKVQRVAVPVGL